ncbi:16S rRNA (cytosine(1402)-N(4))-methyltransferase RsmH [Candidatus Giovannonibacteria bacterium]|nr:16S rRNA (cytosine(1402)-N(4))-methyltransferase RsmH [Candidatus Giovannonibacteria bacterium]
MNGAESKGVSESQKHIPVLLKESIEGLNLKKNSLVMDVTADGGGHLGAILEKLGKNGKIIALDWDPEMITRLQKKFGREQRVKIFNLNFRFLEKLASTLAAAWRRPDAIFFDLGLSTLQLMASGRGFSFQKTEPLLMTFEPSRTIDARKLVNEENEKTLADIIFRYGEERFSRRIAKAIVNARRIKKIETSNELAQIILRAVGRRGKIHPATKTFQALRIYLNEELLNLEEGLKGAFKILKPQGRIAVISFHSLEDRIVKNYFRERAREGSAKLITKKPKRPGEGEVALNPSARSSKLRILEKIC